ncbi:MBOAT family O-acyltransferase [Marinicella sediminis]|uniref:Probable alginate O-acetylase n=1 Tax=Marinicella sediminis TaxID=1792834 RepID=A0ABV7JAA2_9GAMM|nr:MBOAT family O-acyltransferase [Marinicella sediminis]
MLFNSLLFLLVFLPGCLLLFWSLNRYSPGLAAVALILCSLFFYGWWKWSYLYLLLISMMFNYFIGIRLQKNKSMGWLATGVVANLAVLIYFKYTNLILETLAGLGWHESATMNIVLPLAISFFTFQQIAYLVDSHQGKVKDQSLASYALFVTFFPQLISGPIVHHSEMMPQFHQARTFQHKLMAAGMTFFIIGLFKKVGVADELAWYVKQVFEQENLLQSSNAREVWMASVAYTFQIYFDFSGYSDMAIGLGLMFGVFLPINFNSPLKSTSIIMFWRTWHMTLSRFLKDYLYIPLGGNRKGYFWQMVFLMVTMLLGGLWHGAAYTFLLWGGMHGVFLIINHVFRKWLPGRSVNARFSQSVWHASSWLMTFLAVVLAFVVFRVNDLHLLGDIMSLMFFIEPGVESGTGVFATTQVVFLLGWLLSLVVVVTALPNTQQIMGYDVENKVLTQALWKPNGLWVFVIFLLSAISFFKIMTNGYTEFIYRFF